MAEITWNEVLGDLWNGVKIVGAFLLLIVCLIIMGMASGSPPKDKKPK